MPAPRKYTDAQRQALFRLYEAGIGPTELSRMAAAGETGISPFEIPRKSAEAIVKEMAAAARFKVPTTVVEIESAEIAERFPSRGARIIDAELKRLEIKQAGGKALGEKELERVSRLVDYGARIRRHLQAAPLPRRPRTSDQASQGAGPEGQGDSALERLAKEEAERERGGEQLSRTRTPPAEGETDVDRDVATPPAASQKQAVLDPRKAALGATRAVAAEHGVLTPELEAVRVPDAVDAGRTATSAPRTQQAILEAQRKASEALTQRERADRAA